MTPTGSAGPHDIETPAYSLRVNPEGTHALLAAPDGRPWSLLSLIACADSDDVRDETLPGVTLTAADAGGHPRLTVAQPTAAWRRKTLVVDCLPDRLELTLRLEGDGRLGRMTLLGGRAVRPSGASGTFRSSIHFRSVFVPAPTEPVSGVRPSSVPAVLGAVGDAEHGRLHSIFAPPPLCFAFGRAAPGSATSPPPGDWLAAWLTAPVGDLGFGQVGYAPLDGGFLFEFDYEGHTAVQGAWTSPTLVLKPTASAWSALSEYAGLVRAAPPGAVAATPAWWRRPIFCGWGAQCALVRDPDHDQEEDLTWWDHVTQAPSAQATQAHYDRWLARLGDHGVRPGTVVLDDKWQRRYGTAEPDEAKWPDLRAWIARQHQAGRRVLLWWKAWDPEGVPAEECILDPRGHPVAVDPGNPAYADRLRATIAGLLGADGLDADGLKVDFTQRLPTASGLRGAGPWGIAGLHRLLTVLYEAAKADKPDALVVTHAVHPSFADVTDMVRLNDVLRRSPDGERVPVTRQLEFRHRVIAGVLPDKLIDTDQWPMPSLAEWRRYVRAQWRLGVPALYYVDFLDRSGEPLTPGDLALVRQTWDAYDDRRR